MRPHGRSLPDIAAIQEENERKIQSKYAASARNPGREATSLMPAQQIDRERREGDAAKVLQRAYRGHRQRRQENGFNLDPMSRWIEAIKEAQYRNLTAPRSRTDPTSPTKEAHENPSTQSQDDPSTIATSRKSSSARSTWLKAGRIARRAAQDEGSSLSSDSSASSSPSAAAPSGRLHSILSRRTLTAQQKEERVQRRLAEKQDRVKSAKTMDLSYFLEMVDHKHRYGSNLRKYHAEWNQRSTNENFFYWLDHGDGRDLDVEKCSRKRLDDMQVRYLSREERMLYEVVVDKQGKLVWRKDGVPVDTSDKWRDSVNGIVRMNDPAPLWADRSASLRGSSMSSNMSSQGSEHEEETSTGQAVGGEESIADTPSNGIKGEFEAPTTEGMQETYKPQAANSEHAQQPEHSILVKLELGSHEQPRAQNATCPAGPGQKSNEQQSKRKDGKRKKQKWIFVTDTKNNLYIGIKQPGAFQHSSFLHGSRISAAGLIQVRNGQLRILQPRSGHYRTPSHNLHIFIKSLQARGVDMSFLAIGGSYAASVGIETYMKMKGKLKGLKSHVKGRETKQK